MGTGKMVLLVSPWLRKKKKKNRTIIVDKKNEKEEPKPVPHAVASGNGTSEVKKNPQDMSLDEQNELYRQDPDKWRSMFEK